jgi:hypothetical protein
MVRHASVNRGVDVPFRFAVADEQDAHTAMVPGAGERAYCGAMSGRMYRAIPLV